MPTACNLTVATPFLIRKRPITGQQADPTLTNFAWSADLNYYVIHHYFGERIAPLIPKAVIPTEILKSHFYISIFFILAFSSCITTKTTSLTNLTPSLSVNGTEVDSAIINYKADYGFDSHDGDVLKGEIEINISELVQRSQTLIIGGYLTGTYINDSEEKLINANIKVLDSKRNTLEEFRADSVGSFELNFDYKNGYLLEFNYIGYRTLFVDISKLLSKV